MSMFSFGKKSVEQIIREGVKTDAELKQLIEAACEKGAIYAKVYLDAHFAEQKRAQDVLLELISRLGNEQGVLYYKGEIEKSIEEGGVHSSFATVELIASSYLALLNICLRYGPTSIEIIQPKSVTLSYKQSHDVLLSASDFAHQYSKYILEHSMHPDEKAAFQEGLKRRAETGEKLRSKSTKN